MEWLNIYSFDYSQIELRILTHFTNEVELLKAFNNEEDIPSEYENSEDEEEAE